MKKIVLMTLILVSAILIAILDVILSATGLIPVFGDFSAITGNVITEIIELGLIIGLFGVAVNYPPLK